MPKFNITGKTFLATISIKKDVLFTLIKRQLVYDGIIQISAYFKGRKINLFYIFKN